MAYDFEGRAAYPLSDLFQPGAFPLADLIPPDALTQVFGGLYYTEARGYPFGDSYLFDVHLAFEGELALTPPGTQALAVVFGDTTGGWTVLETQIVIGPQGSIALIDVPVTLRVPRDVLRDVATDGPAEITGFTATFELSSDGFSIETDAVLNLAECEVAGSGVTISAAGVTWNFQRGATLPEAAAAGISGEFIGVAFQQVAVKLPPDFAGAPALSLDYCCIGTGGFTGGVSVGFGQPPTCQIGGFSVALERVGIRFQESRLVSGEVAATLQNLDFFETDVAVDLQLSAGGLKVALAAAPNRQTDPNASVSNGLVTLRKPGLIEMTLTAAELRIGSGGGALRLSGTITPLFGLPGGSALPGFGVEALTIASTGEVSLEGGWINLPDALRVQLGPFGLELTRVGLGTEPNGERWISFSGGLSLAEGIPISAAVDGLKIRWDSTGVKGVELSGIKLVLTIEGVLHLEGEVRYNADGQRFDGAATLHLIALNLIVSVRVVIGKRADYTYFYLYLMVAPPIGLPIFQTGLAFYGAEALYAHNMAPDKQPAENWYLDWYRRPLIGAIDQTKWADVKGAQAFGAGVILGTFPDKGYGVAVKGLLILVLPGPIIMLDARANLLKEPSALALPNSQALFTALVIYDGLHGTIQLGIEPHYVFPDAGELIDVTGVAEAFYSFNDPRAWYVYLGRREREKRIRARIIKLFEANAYLMLEPDSLEMGGFIGYSKSLSAGPARIVLEAYIEGAARVSWRPKQFNANLHLQGTIALSVAGIGFDVSASAAVEVAAPLPFSVDAEVNVRANLPWPIPDLETSVRLHWESPGPPRVTAPLQSVGIVHPITTATWSLEGVEPVIPLDGRPSIAFDRAVNDLAQVGDNAMDASDRQVGEYFMRSNLTSIELLVESHGVWVPFATPSGSASGPPYELYGAWQVQPGDSAQGNRRLTLWARTPYEWTRVLETSSTRQLEESERFDPCDPLGEPIVIDFNDHPNEILVPHGEHEYRDVRWTPGPAGAQVIEVQVATAGRSIAAGLPKSYYRCLSLPDQFALVTVPAGGGGVSTGGGGTPPPVSPSLRIEFPADVGGVTVLTLATGPWSLAGFDSAGNRVASAQTTNMSFPHGDFRPTQLTVRDARLRRIDLQCSHRCAVLSVVAREAATTSEQAAQHASLQQMLERYKSNEPVLQPNRRYKLSIATTVVERNGESLVGAQVEKRAGVQHTISGSTCTFTEEYLFRTEGAPGDTALTPTSASPDSAAPLDTLEAYVRQVLPARGTPAAYRTYDVRVDFNTDYVAQMYVSNGQTLEIELRSDEGEVLVLANRLGAGRELVLRREETDWLSTLSRSTCQLTIATTSHVRESTVDAQLLPGASLGARRRYDAVLRGKQPGKTEATKPLYQWSFVSSAFDDFADHLRLRGRVRIATLANLAGGAWAAQAAVAIAAGDPWETADATERARRRAIEIDTFETLFTQTDCEHPLPSVVEMAAVVDGGATWGILLSSPEPFDWDRVQFACTRKEIVVEGAGCFAALFGLRQQPTIRVIESAQPVRVLRDADGTRALLLRGNAGAGQAFSTGDYTLTGTFKRDAGAGLPVLTKAGSAAPEQVSIAWALPLSS